METYRVLIVDDNESIHRDFRSLLDAGQERDDFAELADLALEVFGGEEVDGSRPSLPRYAFDSAYQGADALESVRRALEEGRSYALAFMDVRMPPGWDGVETIQRIWEIDPSIQMIICSAYADYSWNDIVKELGATDRLLLLRKPFDPDSVKQMTLAVVCRWHHERQNRARIAELEALAGDREQELAGLRAEIDRLASEVDEMKSRHALDARTHAEQATRIRDELVAIIAALEDVATVPLSESQMATVQAALQSGRTLLDELARDLAAS